VQPDQPDFPDVTWRRPSPRMWTARKSVLFTAAFPVGIAIVASAAAAGGAAGSLGALATCAVATGLTWVGLRGRYRSWAYAERVDDLLVRRGLLVRRLSVVPYGRMQFVDVSAGPVDRLFGLATVQLRTAAAATDARIPGLSGDEAARLRDRLAALGEANAAGL
jgi:membrane protein YdbS with pleckstrin-like domain